MDLLHAQFNHGRLSLEEIKSVLGSDFGAAWPSLSKKFAVDETGKYFNVRCEQEKNRRAEFVKSRSNGKAGKKKSHEISHDNHMINHTENENENRNEPVLEKGVQGEKPFEETLWTTVSKNFINDFIWKEKFCRDKNFPIAELEKLLKIFIADIDLKHDYKPLKELQSHFVNWFNKNKYADSKVRNRVDDLHEYARRHD